MLMAFLGLAAAIGAAGVQEGLSVDKQTRCVLEGLPRVGFYDGNGSPEDDLFPSAIKSFLQWKGEDLGFDDGRPKDHLWHDVHMFLSGTSGCEFRMGWRRSRWDMAATSVFEASTDPLRPFREGFDSAGYEFRVELRKAQAEQLGLKQQSDPTREAWKKLIVQSIRDKKRPVIAFGVVGPEVCLVTGYDEGGDVLIGWSGFQTDPSFNGGVEFEKSGYFRKRDWFSATQGLILIGDPKPRPASDKTYLRALKHGLELMRTPKVRGYETGMASFTAWADDLLNDELFAEGNPQSAAERHAVHHMTAGALAEARAYGADFLRFAAEALPKARNELLDAARCFSDEHDLVWAIWEFTGGWQGASAGGGKMASDSIRRRLVPLIRLARERDVEAARLIEKALRTYGEKPPMVANVLAGVPRVGYDKRLCPLPGTVEAIMEYLGDPVDYDFLMGVSGAAFRRVWERDDGGNIDLMFFYPEPHRRIFRAINYEYRECPKGDLALLIGEVKRSIEKGRPVIGFGIVGPPEAGIVTGYEKDGEVLRGWSYFGEDRKNYYSVKDWDEKIGTPHVAAIAVGDKERYSAPDRREILQSALKWAIDLERNAKRSEIPKHVCGLAAYESWAGALEIDKDYPQADAKVMETRAMIHGDQCVMLEERRNAAAFLRMMSNVEPKVADILERAAKLYDETAEEGKFLWRSRSCNYADPEVWKWLSDPKIRRDMAVHIRAAAAKEAQAVELLEQALAKLDSPV